MHWHSFFFNSSSAFCAGAFLSIKNKAEKHIINFKSGNTEVYNELFCVEELCDPLHRSHDTAVGSDNIHYQLLKYLPESSLLILLTTFNQVWTTGCFLSNSKKAVIPIPKFGKDPVIPSNCCPIAFTSCKWAVLRKSGPKVWHDGPEMNFK